MSYQCFQQRCEACGSFWNAAFGIVGTTQIAAPPTKCPSCGSSKIVHHAHGWAGMPSASEPQPVTADAPPADPAITDLRKALNTFKAYGIEWQHLPDDLRDGLLWVRAQIPQDAPSIRACGKGHQFGARPRGRAISCMCGQWHLCQDGTTREYPMQRCGVCGDGSADAPPAETPQPIHNSCHEVWCNGSRHEPRGAKGYSCSCRPRGSIADKAECRAEQAEAERDAAAISYVEEVHRLTDREIALRAERDALKAELATRPTVSDLTDALCEQMEDEAVRAAATVFHDARETGLSAESAFDLMKSVRYETYRSFLARVGLLAPAPPTEAP